MNHRVSRRLFVAFVSAALVGIVGAGPAGAQDPAGAARRAEPAPVLGTDQPNAIDGSYIVVFKAGTPAANRSAARQSALANGGTVTHEYSAALSGFAARLPANALNGLRNNPHVDYIEADATVQLAADQPNPPSWGLDRIDQRNLPLNNNYHYDATGAGVTAYIIDTGILTTHTDFGGRAVSGYDAIDGTLPATDCHGHGTHVAGTVGGNAHGVAKGVSLVAVRVLNCQGSGTNAQVIAGIDWVTGNHTTGRAVANMSLGGSASQATDDAVNRAIADGVTMAVAAGNGNQLGIPQNACNYSPARVPNAITVAASDRNDRAASFTNYGTCVDIIAPGVDITSSWIGSNTATNTISGTSMATPHVAGVAALYLQGTAGTPQQVRDALVNAATPNVVTNLPGSGTPNRLLYSLFGAPSGVSVTNPGSRTATVGTATSLQMSASGGTPPYSWSDSGLPPGLSINSSSGLISGTPTSAGTYNATVTATDSAATPQSGSASFTWTVTAGPVPGCSGSNSTDVQIPDNTTVESPITISGCSGNASSGSTVAVNIVHTYIGDLIVSLIAPDGSAYVLHNRTGGGTDNINQTYTTNVSSEAANGTWKLRVQDAASVDTGYINSWTLNLATTPACTSPGTNSADVQIPDNTTVESPITISGCSGNASAASTVAVNIVHTYVGDLIVSLIAPDGSAYVLRSRTGGSADNINQTFTVNLSSEVRNGTWKLRVQDAANVDTGYINSWTLTV